MKDQHSFEMKCLPQTVKINDRSADSEKKMTEKQQMKNTK